MQQGTAGLKEVCPGERTMLEVQDLLLRNYSLHYTLWKTVGVMHRLYVITSDTSFAVCHSRNLCYCFIWLTYLSPVYTIQPVVQPVVKLVWQLGKCLYTRYNRLSKPVVKPVWQPVVLCIQTFNRLSNPFDNRFDKMAVSCIQPVVKPVVQPGLTTGWTNSCSFNTVVKPCLSNWFDKHGLTTSWTNRCSFNTVVKQVVNRSDNRLDVCLHDAAGCQTGCTTGCIV